MAGKTASRSFLPLFIIFLVTNILFITGRSMLVGWHVDADVLIIGNLVLFAAAAFSFVLYYRSLRSSNPYAIVRMIYGGVLAKMIICLVAIFIYIAIAGKGVNKQAIFGCMFLYVLYTVVEISTLLKLSKQNKNA